MYVSIMILEGYLPYVHFKHMKQHSPGSIHYLMPYENSIVFILLIHNTHIHMCALGPLVLRTDLKGEIVGDY